ncbi:MAG: GTPase Era [Clostridiales bacterium]|nr:GTPase Era [Clostridiales bacterium]MDD6053958.1 GTPase Era [Clostridiales bacterium]MDY5677535.1 GTPase Era [Eubacteriales bacterium]
MSESFKSGFIAVVGRANAGKSTLVNAFVGQKISIVSPKPQTTRENILGIWTDETCQMIFVDTPGALNPKTLLGDFMVRSIEQAVVDVDCILLVIDGHDGIKQADFDLIDKYGKADAPLVVAVTKTDISQPEKMMAELAKLNKYDCIREIFAVSARRNRGVEELKTHLKNYLNDDRVYFDEDYVTDRPQRFLVCEEIREKTLLCLNEEVPHGIGISLNKMTFNEEEDRWEIDADIIVEKASHKSIVLGKKGRMIKSIGMAARESIQKMLEARVRLDLWVRVKEDWRNSERMLNEIGYNKKDLD